MVNGGNPQGWRALPISGRWLESIGFQRRVTPRGNVYWHRGLVTFYTTVQFCGCSLDYVVTCGQLADLIDVLSPLEQA